MPLTIEGLEDQISTAREEASKILEDRNVSKEAWLIALAITQVGAEIAQAILQTDPARGVGLSMPVGFADEAPPGRSE